MLVLNPFHVIIDYSLGFSIYLLATCECLQMLGDSQTDIVTEVPSVFDQDMSHDSWTLNTSVNPVGQLTIQNSGWTSRLTQCVSSQTASSMIVINNNNASTAVRGHVNLIPENKVCLVPVDVSTGQIVENLPKLLVPLQSKIVRDLPTLQPLAKKIAQKTVPGNAEKPQLIKIVSVNSLTGASSLETVPSVIPQNQQLTLTFRLPSPDTHSSPLPLSKSTKSISSVAQLGEATKNTIVQLPYPGAGPGHGKPVYAIHQESPNLQSMHAISGGTDPPNILEIGGVSVENTDLLSQAVWFKGGERGVNCITYSYDTICQVVAVE